MILKVHNLNFTPTTVTCACTINSICSSQKSKNVICYKISLQTMKCTKMLKQMLKQMSHELEITVSFKFI